MSGQGFAQIVFYCLVLIALGYPLGIFMARAYSRERLDPVERGFLRLLGRGSGDEQDWKSYAKTVLIFSVAFSAVLYAIQRLQGHLFLNPDHMKGVAPHIAVNTTASFVTNTNWQYYGGEYTMSYLTQMAGLAVQNFVSAAVGMAVLIAVIRGIARRSSSKLGNFWRDLYRSLVYILLPLSIVLAVLLIWQGVPQTFHGHATATTLQGAHQTIARGPVASQIAIKQLGTNGGGFYNSNSAVPFENPNGFTNFLEMLSILLIPAAQVFMFGKLVLARRHALMVFLSMFVVFALGVAVNLPAEQHGSAVLRQSGVNLTQGHGQSGGNMADKEVRFGLANTSVWTVATSDASNGSVNGGFDAQTPAGGAVPLVNLFLGEVIFGGVGSGLYGMFFYILIAVFVAGLMVGRTPEWLGKKIEAREMKIAAVGALFVPTMVLDADGDLDLDPLRARLHLQQRRPRLHRDALRLRLPVEQQRQRVRRLRRHELLRGGGHDRPDPRPVRAGDRRARARRRARAEEDRARVRRHIPNRRADVRRAARRGDRADGRPDDLPGADTRPDRRRADALMRALVRSVIVIVLATRSLRARLSARADRLRPGRVQEQGERQSDHKERNGRRLAPRCAGLHCVPVLPPAPVRDRTRV